MRRYEDRDCAMCMQGDCDCDCGTCASARDRRVRVRVMHADGEPLEPPEWYVVGPGGEWRHA